jgi:hypothetical protein
MPFHSASLSATLLALRSGGRAGLGRQRGDAAGDEVQVLSGGEHALAGLQRLDRVLPVGQHVGQERLRLRDQVALRVVVRHVQVLRRAAQAHHVQRVQLDLHVVAELGRQLERLGAAGDVVQLQRAHAVTVLRRLVLADHALEDPATAQQRELHIYIYIYIPNKVVTVQSIDHQDLKEWNVVARTPLH